MATAPGRRPEMGPGKSELTFAVGFEVAVDRGWLDLTPPAGASMQRKGCGGVAERVEEMGSWAHGDVGALGVVACSLQGQQGGGAGVHGHVVVFGVGAV